MNQLPAFERQVPTVLVVDDTSSTLSMLARRLEEQHLRVVVAEEGEEAIARARVVRPDLVLLDVMLPGMDGFETCRRLKADEATRNIPVIFMTALTDTRSKIAGFEAGGVDFVTKPIQLEEVMARVQTHLALHALQRDLARRVGERTAALGEANRMLRILSDCNQAVVRATDEAELLRDICRIIAEVGGYPLAWVGFAEKDEARTVRVVAHDGSEDGYLETASISWGDTELGQDPVGRAIRTGKTTIVQDIHIDPGFSPWRDEVSRRGFGSAIALPLRSDDEEVMGGLNIFSSRTDAFHVEEVLLLTELAGDLAYGIRSLRARIAHAEADALLWRLKEFNEGILRNMGEGLLAVDGREIITFVNPALAALLGYGAKELLGRSWGVLIPPDQQGMVGGRLAPAGRIAAGRHELELLRKDRARVPGLASISVHSSADSPSGGYLMVFTDLSERKQLVHQLVHAQKMEAVGRLAGGVAHDFNNLLSVILGFSDLLLPSFQQEDPRRHHIEEIWKAAGRAEGLTRQLLAFSRRQVLQPQVIELNGILENLEKMLRRLIGADIELHTDLAAKLPCIKADPGQIEQVVLNLVVNSRDAMEKGGTLRIETRAVTLDAVGAGEHGGLPPGAYVALVVSDTGTGIPPGVLPHVFEPFFTTKPEGKGTGLGLSTVYGIVKQSGGHVDVDSEIDRGTTFRIHLPAVTAKNRRARAARSAPVAVVGTETILLVEDEECVRAMARQVLLECGYRVLEAGSGAEALELSAHHAGPLHMLLTDIMLPGGMNGWELTRHLLTLRPGIKVLCVSGYVCDPEIPQGIEARSIPFLPKPFRSSELVQKVRAVLDAPAPT